MQANGSKYNKTSSMHAKVSNSQINIFPSKSVKSRRLMFCWKFIRIMETFYTNESSSKKKDWFLHPNQQIDPHNTKRNCDCECILYSILTWKMLLLIPWTRYYSIWELSTFLVDNLLRLNEFFFSKCLDKKTWNMSLHNDTCINKRPIGLIAHLRNSSNQ